MIRAAKSVLCRLYKHSGAMVAQELLTHWLGHTAMTVLVFHRVTDEIPEDGLTVSTARFRRICGMLRHGFDVVPLDTIFRIAALGGARAPPDGGDYLRRLLPGQPLRGAGAGGVRAAGLRFFVPTAFVGTTHVFPWDRGLKRMANLTWDDLRAMVALGFEIGSHSVTHADFGQLSAAQAHQELRDSKSCLEDRLGRPVRWFAYPFGARHNFRPEWLPLVEETGYTGALSAYGGSIRRGDPTRLLPREAVPFFHSVEQLELHLAGCLFWFYRLKRRLREVRPQTAAAGGKRVRDAEPVQL